MNVLVSGMCEVAHVHQWCVGGCCQVSGQQNLRDVLWNFELAASAEPCAESLLLVVLKSLNTLSGNRQRHHPLGI